MNKNYTTYNEQSISNFRSDDADSDAIDFLKDPNNFRPFKQGLTELLKRKNFKGNLEEPMEKAQYLIAKLHKIASNIKYETVYSWFSGKHSPKIEPGSRKRMYEICFALELSFEETVWFFHHVYYDRCFNCHTIEEAVFYFSFLHGTSYQNALDVIEAVNSASVEPVCSDDTTLNYTKFIQERISNFKTIEELQDFLITNKHTFCTWNNSSLKSIKNLFSEITGSESSKEIITKLKSSLKQKLKSKAEQRHLNELNADAVSKCGLLIREIYFDAQSDGRPVAEYILDIIDRKNTFANTFVLDRLLSTTTGINKKPDIPYIVKNNFPSKKVMSDVLDESKISVSKSYDSIRKILVLLDFYVFWVRVKLKISDVADFDKDELFQIYKDEADSLLYQCGYEPLYTGNPYDWLFLCSAQNEDPLYFFRSCIGNLLDE